MSAQVAADLRAAADVLERDGWTQRTVGEVHGCKCAIGAIQYVASNGRAVGEEDLTGEERNRADEAETEANNMLGRFLSDFNDESEQTAAEVIAALRAAADRAEAEQ